MPWRFSEDVEPYAEAVLPLLRRDPAARTVALTVVDALLAGQRFSDQPNSIGWSEKRWPARSASMTVSATVRAAGFCRSSGSTASA